MKQSEAEQDESWVEAQAASDSLPSRLWWGGWGWASREWLRPVRGVASTWKLVAASDSLRATRRRCWARRSSHRRRGTSRDAAGSRFLAARVVAMHTHAVRTRRQRNARWRHTRTDEQRSAEVGRGERKKDLRVNIDKIWILNIQYGYLCDRSAWICLSMELSNLYNTFGIDLFAINWHTIPFIHTTTTWNKSES